jgi:dephospho-CoA kinase
MQPADPSSDTGAAVPSGLRILTVGLTGGIASGKSTVGAVLAGLGAFVVDADQLTHQVSAPGGTAHEALLARFGEDILDDAGQIDRAALGRLVFEDDRARLALNAIVHPEVRRQARRRFAECAADRRARVAVFDAALLVETGAYRDFDRLLVVSCSVETQLRRVIRRTGLTREQAQARIDAQASLDRKLALADYVIDTDSPLDHTRRRAEEVYRALLSDFERLYGAG